MSHCEKMDLNEWPQDLYDELLDNTANGRVGMVLTSQTEQFRIWQIRLDPGARIPFHRHVLDYFWTSHAEGVSRSHYGDGKVCTSHYRIGDTRHFKFARGESMIHDLENIGETTLIFTTVESLNSANTPLPLD